MMNSRNNRLHYLIQSYMDNVIDTDELKELKTYLRNTNSDEGLDAVVHELWSQLDLTKPLSIRSDLIYKRIAEDERLQKDNERVLSKTKSTKMISLLSKHWFAKVASILVFGTALFFYYQPAEKGIELQTSRVQKASVAEVLPGGNRAMLTLTDGTVINLDRSANGDVAEEAGMRIVKTDDGEIFYEGISGETSVASGHHEIRTPRGGQYKLILPDGTKVWLNSLSSLRYPIQFDGNDRLVELTGEAYFEVATKKLDPAIGVGKRQPFIVKSNTQTVEVLGTHFNINSYDEESSVKTTLLEGSVLVRKNNASQESPVVLKPGQQAQLKGKDHNSEIQVLTIDAEEAMAWRNGSFLFKNTPLSEVMNQLSRWYDVEIDKENIPNYKFNGFIPRDEPLSKVLDMLELTGDLKFNIHNNQISILK